MCKLPGMMRHGFWRQSRGGILRFPSKFGFWGLERVQKPVVRSFFGEMMKICLKWADIEVDGGGGVLSLGNGKQTLRRSSKLGMEMEE